MLYDKLQSDGFVIFDLLSSIEIDYLNDLCKQYLKIAQQDFISGSHFLSKKDNIFINAELHKILKSKTDKLFPSLELLGGTLATKIKGKSILKAHNDWDIVDEVQFNSYNLWITLVNTDKNNGTLGLIPNSHLWQYGHRGFGIEGNFEKFTKQLISFGIEPELKAGQAILYNHKLIHFSRANTKEQPRNVAIIGMKDKDASLQVSFCSDGINIETYSVVQDDFYGFDIQRIKQNKLISKEKKYSKSPSLNQILTTYYQYLSNEYKVIINPHLTFIDKIKMKYSELFS